ncbi:MAG: NAD(P)H-dependent oxidoreductase [Deltaproteobacteria bacterium]|nr:NAD(P)H-dependent oxidoreductase [Candidatus Zymogenaceae bacterium]
MKITILAGSPKGETSVTMQYVNYIIKKFPGHEYATFHVAQRIKTIEKDEKAFSEIIDSVRTSDAVLWAFPLYYLVVHSGLKRFIELIGERGAEDAFAGKYAASLSTSIHFYDQTAHAYVRGISEDLGMRYAGYHSPEMHDLILEKERKRLLGFAGDFLATVEKKLPVSRFFSPLSAVPTKYVPARPTAGVDPGDKKIVVLTDATDGQTNLLGMVERFCGSFTTKPVVVNLNDIDIAGGCLGCIRCGWDNTCAYTGKDGFVDFYRETIIPADILVIAGAIKDRYLSSRFKLFFDRSFFMTHIPVMEGKQVAFLVSGPLSQATPLSEALRGYFETQGASIVDFVSDETAGSAQLDGLITGLAGRLVWAADAQYIRSMTFLGFAGRKIFRDDVWGRLRFPFVSDYRYYKKHGLLAFPQKTDKKFRMVNIFLTLLAHIRPIREKIYGQMIKHEMVKPIIRAVEKY